MVDETLVPVGPGVPSEEEAEAASDGAGELQPLGLTVDQLEALLFVAERPLSRREIAALAEALTLPLNVLFGAVPVPRLAELGVARVSTGSLLYRVALGAAERTAAAVRDGGKGFDAPSYATVDALARS